MSEILTNSRLKAQRACSRLQHLRYEIGVQPIYDGDALKFGTLFHAGLEAWWKAWQLPADERLAVALAALSYEADPFERAKAEVMMFGYHLRWGAEPYDVIAVEAPFECALRNPQTGAASRTWRLAGKLDAIVIDRRDGLTRIVEHKTSSEDVSPGSEYWRRLRMDGQVSVYYEGARMLGHDVAGCVYDVAGKPAIRPGTVALVDGDGIKIVHDATGERVRTKDGKKWRQTGDTEAGYVLQSRPETPEEYRARLVELISENPGRFFQRGEVVRLDEEMREAMSDVWQIGQAVRENQLNRTWPRNPDACARFGRTCAFFSVCSGEASLDDTTKFTRLENVHPELAEVVDAQGS